MSREPRFELSLTRREIGALLGCVAGELASDDPAGRRTRRAPLRRVARKIGAEMRRRSAAEVGLEAPAGELRARLRP